MVRWSWQGSLFNSRLTHWCECRGKHRVITRWGLNAWPGGSSKYRERPSRIFAVEPSSTLHLGEKYSMLSCATIPTQRASSHRRYSRDGRGENVRPDRLAQGNPGQDQVMIPFSVTGTCLKPPWDMARNASIAPFLGVTVTGSDVIACARRRCQHPCHPGSRYDRATRGRPRDHSRCFRCGRSAATGRGPQIGQCDQGARDVAVPFFRECMGSLRWPRDLLSTAIV
jgi:hypothetical protein